MMHVGVPWRPEAIKAGYFVVPIMIFSPAIRATLRRNKRFLDRVRADILGR